MSIERRNFPQFFITAPSPCPYLPGRVERKVFTHLVGQDARGLNTQLSQGGFRRSQNIAYRPACDGCAACVSVRVPVNTFDYSRGYRRNLRINADIDATVVKSSATSEHYSLFRAYIDSRHGDGGMADMTALDFAAMVDDNFVDSRLVEYRLRLAGGTPGPLVACVLIDVLGDGISMIYSFYEPDLARRGLGTLMILDNIARVKRLGLPYLYLGYWVRGSSKMDYKSRFLPQERLTADGWILLRPGAAEVG
ncbi:MAG TPA: arginyltransferase [Aestuariivirga sp.]|nr:arginyltransferase [Alphaproteobacteria bacterium]HRX35758.1 arginyltransferase [Aestuariivirga sp.]